ncbi:MULTISPECIES: hypothetical protein [unclassified Sphingomonas]|uniref:hypothetical protein n=1 Tax=unclassified Sphingomonas TaxID=196159 RepID=UPI001F5AF0D5|nr:MULTISPECIES: hypothetical protein [unclassified Sphingomonas]
MDHAHSLHAGNRGDFIVRSPRETDAVGTALKGAFSSRIDLPTDMRHALEQLDRIPIGR